jgi:thiol:disulfide interchange protein DsbD
MYKILTILLAAGYLCVGSIAYATSLQEEEILQGRLILPVKQITKEESYSILIELNITNGWHINSNQPLEDFLIPTEITFQTQEGISYGRIQYMQPELKNFAFSDTKMSVYEGVVYARSSITVSPDYADSVLIIKGNIYYQACNDQSCLAPTEINIFSEIDLVKNKKQIEAINQTLFNRILPQLQEVQAPAQREISNVAHESGIFYTFIFIFIGGLALNLTPCVYPLIPITISYFAGQSKGQKGTLVIRAIIYVVGMAITYSILGVVAALTGGLLGSALQNPIVLIFIALVLVALALSMFGLYEIRVPQSLAKIGGKNRSGYLGTLFMGLTVGLIAAPCIGPFVLGLLTYVGELADPFLGFWMFFILAIGLGTPFLLLGIFSGAATSIPRSGAWMVWVRNIFGFVLIGMAIYFLEPLFPGTTFYYYTLAIVAIIAGIYLGWLDKNTGKITFKIIRNITGVVFILLGIFFALPSASEAGNQIEWQAYTPEIMQRIKETNQPIIIDFYADWCLPCKELDKFTFSNPEVIEAAKNFVTIKVDLTRWQNEASDALRRELNIKGVPTIVFIGKQGNEITKLRLIEFEEATQFLNRMKKALH